MQDYDAKMFFVQGRLMTPDDLDFYSQPLAEDRETESPGRSRFMYSDEIGMSGGRRRSASRGEPRSSSPQKRATGSKAITSTSAARRR